MLIQFVFALALPDHIESVYNSSNKFNFIINSNNIDKIGANVEIIFPKS